MKRGALALRIPLGMLVLAALACGKKEAPSQVRATAASLAPWTSEDLNGVLVLRGEVDRPVDLVLEGRSIRETHHADIGPVRWEMPHPPRGEVARLRTVEGQVLAEWRFGRAPRAAKLDSNRRVRMPAPPPDDPLEILRRQLAAARPPASPQPSPPRPPSSSPS